MKTYSTHKPKLTEFLGLPNSDFLRSHVYIKKFLDQSKSIIRVAGYPELGVAEGEMSEEENWGA